MHDLKYKQRHPEESKDTQNGKEGGQK
jgi:hypothetical protein